MKEFISELKESKHEKHDMLDKFNCLTLKILCRTAMGVDVGKENAGMGSHKVKKKISLPNNFNTSGAFFYIENSV